MIILMARTDPYSQYYQWLFLFLAEKLPGTEGGPFPAPGMTGGEIKVLSYRRMKEYELSFVGFAVRPENRLGVSRTKPSSS